MENTTKTCSKCKNSKSLPEFYASKINKGGLSGKCKECTKEMFKSYAKTEKAKLYMLSDRRKEITYKAAAKWNKKQAGKPAYIEMKKKAARKAAKKATDNITSSYARRLLNRLFYENPEIPKITISQELIELKQLQLKLHKLCHPTPN